MAEKQGKPRNYRLPSGIMRHSKSAMYHKTGKWIMKARYGQQGKNSTRVSTKGQKTKEIGGQNNGGTRTVSNTKSPRVLPELQGRKVNKKRTGKIARHSKRLRTSITPGTILILLAGRHRGKRVIFLKQLKSGLLLVTGPWRLNRCPLRRVNQRYVIASSTHVDISKVTIPDHIDDAHFKRKKANKADEASGPFAEKDEKYKLTDQRVKDQVAVDKQILAVIAQHPEKRLLRGYFSTHFSLSNKQFPHTMKF